MMPFIKKSDVYVDLNTGELSGNIITSEKTIDQLENIFLDEEQRKQMPQDIIVYKVQAHMEETEGKDGGLFFGTSFVSSGKVGNEYFMTKGHYHQKRNAAEYYWCVSGKGMLILMEEDGKCYGELMVPGSLHYIGGNIAHRLANTGAETLVVGACWPSDAMHDYDTIVEKGFTYRLIDVNGIPTLT